MSTTVAVTEQASMGEVMRRLAAPAGGGPVELTGLCAPTGIWTKHKGGHQICFERGVFDRIKDVEVPVLVHHKGPVVGLARVTGTALGLVARIILADTAEGRAAWARVVSGEFKGLSSKGGCLTISRTVDGVEHKRVTDIESIEEVTLCKRGAYAEALIWSHSPPVGGGRAGAPHSIEARASRALDWIEGEMRSEGNPNHDPATGQFSSGPGGAAHGKHHARRERRRRKLNRIRKRFKGEAAELRVRHKSERTGLAERQRTRHEKHKSYYDKRKVQLDRAQGRELAKMDREHAHEIKAMERRRDRERAQEVRDKARGKVSDDQIAKWEADHAKDVAHISGINKKIRQDEVDWHEGQHYELRKERHEAATELKEDHAKQRRGLLKRQRRERSELKDRLRETLEDHGFDKHKSAVAGPPPPSGRSLVRSVHRAELLNLDDAHTDELNALAEKMARDLEAVPAGDIKRRVEIMMARQASGRAIWDRQDRDRAGLRRAQRKTAEAIGGGVM